MNSIPATPFDRTGPDRFHAGPVQVEALARLYYVVEQGLSSGLVCGRSGTGKSLLLDVLSEAARRSGRKVIHVDAAGLNAGELLARVTDIAGRDACSATVESPSRNWRKLDHWLCGLGAARRRAVLVLDHVDRAEASCAAAFVRLGRIAAGSMLTIVAAQRGIGRSAMQDEAAISIELRPLSQSQARDYVEDLTSDRSESRFQPTALDAVHDFTRGVPAAINRLCRLAWLSAAGDPVDEHIIQPAAQELGMARYERPAGGRQPVTAAVVGRR